MLGALTGLTKAVSKESMIKAIRETISVKAIKMSLNSFEKGLTLAGRC
jgi:Pyruvate/2-oxoacid:ferredoxin oxidoreductase gamma subunit